MKELALSNSIQNRELDALVQQANKYLANGRAGNTGRSYASDLRDFRAFCEKYTAPYLPSTPETVALYASSLASLGKSYATIKRRLAAITYAHRQPGIEDSPAAPGKSFVLREVLAGIKRTLGSAQHGASPILTVDIRRIVAACPANLLGARDRSLLLLGLAMGARRSELATSIEVHDLTFTEQGLYILIRHHKTEQSAEGPRTVAVPVGEHSEICPVLATRAWIEAAGIGDSGGPLFRAVDRRGKISASALSPRSIAKIFAKAAGRAGIKIAAENLSPHSLRAGMCTQAAINGAGKRQIAKTTGHRSTVMVQRYIRDAELFRDNASRGLVCEGRISITKVL